MFLGISIVEIEKFIEKRSDNFQENFAGVFSSDHINRFISFHNLIKEKNAKYPFITVNTDKSDKNGMYWWEILDLHPLKNIFLFNSFGFVGLKSFIIQDD